MSVNLVLNKPYFQPGEQVNAIIYLFNPSPTMNCRLYVEIEGEEECGIRHHYTETIRVPNPRYRPGAPPDAPSWEKNPTTTKQVKRHVDLREERDFLRNRFLCQQGSLNMGQYQFPFTFKLPEGIPNSFDFKRGMHDFARIKYKVWTKFETVEGFRVTDKDYMIVKQNFPADFAIRDKAHVHKLNCCCCISKGSLKMNARFEKTVYQPGEQALFLLTVDAGESDVPIQSIKGVCNQKVTIKCQGKHKTFTKEVSADVTQGLPSGSRSGVIQLKPRINVAENEMSTKGNLIQCWYDLTANCVTDLYCQSGGNAQIRLPIIICRMPTTFMNPFVPPSNWNPQIMPNHIVDFNAQNNVSLNPSWAPKGPGNPMDTSMSTNMSQQGMMGNPNMPPPQVPPPVAGPMGGNPGMMGQPGMPGQGPGMMGQPGMPGQGPGMMGQSPNTNYPGNGPMGGGMNPNGQALNQGLMGNEQY